MAKHGILDGNITITGKGIVNGDANVNVSYVFKANYNDTSLSDYIILQGTKNLTGVVDNNGVLKSSNGQDGIPFTVNVSNVTDSISGMTFGVNGSFVVKGTKNAINIYKDSLTLSAIEYSSGDGGTTPDNPDEPDNPTPDNPDNPTPEEPDNPSQGGGSTTPDNPNPDNPTPEQPDNPDNPDEPDEPSTTFSYSHDGTIRILRQKSQTTNTYDEFLRAKISLRGQRQKNESGIITMTITTITSDVGQSFEDVIFNINPKSNDDGSFDEVEQSFSAEDSTGNYNITVKLSADGTTLIPQFSCSSRLIEIRYIRDGESDPDEEEPEVVKKTFNYSKSGTLEVRRTRLNSGGYDRILRADVEVYGSRIENESGTINVSIVPTSYDVPQDFDEIFTLDISPCNTPDDGSFDTTTKTFIVNDTSGEPHVTIIVVAEEEVPYVSFSTSSPTKYGAVFYQDADSGGDEEGDDGGNEGGGDEGGGNVGGETTGLDITEGSKYIPNADNWHEEVYVAKSLSITSVKDGYCWSEE